MQPKIKLNAVDVGSTLTLSVAGGSNVTLTAAEANNAILVFTGVLTGNINVIVPNGPRQYTVNNATTGAFTLTVKTSAGTGVIVTQASVVPLLADGTNVVSVGGSGGSVSEPSGQIVYGTGASVDSNADFTYVAANGTLYVNTTTGTSGSVSVASPGTVALFAANVSGATGAGGDVTISGGQGGSTSGNGGRVTLRGGAATSGDDGSVVVGRSTTSTTRQGDFLYVPTCTGTPTGTPATISGHSPIVVDTTNNKLYFYSGGVWRDAGP